MYRISLFALAIFALSGAACVQADEDAAAPMGNDQVKATISKNMLRLSPQLVVKDVRPFEAIPGLYEVRVDNNLFYTDANGDHLISGHIFSTATRKDLTQARLEDLNRIDWGVLPLKNAIVSGDPKGVPVAVFTDPDCPYCRDLKRNYPR
jgi:thiol:disulfide interchange protein DsbC